MPLGSFRLNGLSKKLGGGGPARTVASTSENPPRSDYEMTFYSTAKFGTYSLRTSNTYSASSFERITINPTDTSFTFNSATVWTMEFWIRFINWDSYTGYNAYFFSASNEDVLSNNPGIWLGKKSGSSGVVFAEGSTAVLATAIASPSTTTWYHIAVVCNGSNSSLYSNGTRVWNGSASTLMPSVSSTFVQFGHQNSIGNDIGIAFDEFRISNIARYTGASITVPTSAFVNDVNTLALFHYNNNRSDTTS